MEAREVYSIAALGALGLDELTALIHYHSGRTNTNGHLMPDSAKRIVELADAVQKKSADMGPGAAGSRMGG